VTAPAPSPARAAAPLPGFLSSGVSPAVSGPREEVVPLTKVRKLIAERPELLCFYA